MNFKKIFSGLFLFSLLLLPSIIFASENWQKYIFYDTNLDKKITIVDISCLIETALNLTQKKPLPVCLSLPNELTKLKNFSMLNLDVNCDNKINVVDIQGSILVGQGFGLSEKIDTNKNGWPDCSEATMQRIFPETREMCSWVWSNEEISSNYELTNIWGTDDSNVFAVGDDVDGELIDSISYPGVILHYDGEKWEKMSIPKVAKLTSIWGTGEDNIFSVGLGGTILHYNGASWQTIFSPTASDLFDVFGFSETEIYAVGMDGLFVYDGNNWQIINELNPKKNLEWKSLSKIWGTAANNLYVMDNTEVYHYNGQSWKIITSDSDLIGKPLALWINSETNDELYMIQESLSGNISNLTDMLVYFKANIWAKSIVELSSELNGYNYYFGGLNGNKSSNLYAVAFAVKQLTDPTATDKSLIMHYDGTKWEKQFFAAPFGLTNIWVADSNEVFSIGIKGANLHYQCL